MDGIIAGPARDSLLSDAPESGTNCCQSRCLRCPLISRKRALMTDQQVALQAMTDAQHILEEFLQPRPHNDKRLLERLVEVFERPDVVVAVDRLQRAKLSENPLA
jgi:phage gp36-like protein